jgi:hypothetical protein
MLGALLYLRFTSLKNLLVSRIRRLRQPKYLIGALVGAAYFYFVIFNGFNYGANRRAAAASPSPAIVTPDQIIPPESGALLMAVGALALLTVFVFMWLLPSKTPGLAFSQAETTFLFPAPISRRALIHFKLCSNQFSVLLQSLFFSLVFNSRALSGGRALQIVIGWWLILTLVNLHYMGASLALARLFERGVSVIRRRLFVLGIIGVAVGVTLFWIRREVHAPTAADMADVESSIRWLMTMLDAGLMHWLLLPFTWVLAPFFATGLKEFAWALIPAVALLLLHYIWVLNMEASFEEASLAQAEKRELRRAGMRAGDFRLGRDTLKARRAPFHLADRGHPEIAFLWKNLLSTHAFLNPKIWLICAGIIVVGTRLVIGMAPAQQNIMSGIGGGALVLGLYVLMFGPLLTRLDLRRDLAHMDVLKTYPIAGWRLVLGELLTPMAIITGVIWLIVLFAACAIQPTRVLPAWLDPSLRITCAACIAAVTPAVVALQLLVPNAAAVVFPAWFQATRAIGGGIELMGQRLIFVFGQVFIIALALLPAVGTAALLIFSTTHLFGAVLAVVFATLVVLAVLIGEFWCALWLLGNRFEKFDLSLEQRP